MAGLNEYKCPCCGGAIEFNSAIQKVKCPYCDTEFEMDVIADYSLEASTDGDDEMNWNMDSTQEWTEGDSEGMRVYVCKSCGGEIIADENTAASSCPFCDNPIVISGSIVGGLRPEYIIPFKLDKKDAMARFKSHLEGKKLLPKVFKTQNHLEEIKGIYVPFWVFDSSTEAKMRYRATKQRTWSDSNNRYKEIRYYSVLREGSIFFESVPVDGSTKLPDDLMESIEPFDHKEAVPFNSAYFAGYAADKYDVEQEKCIERANSRVRRATEEAFRNSVSGFNSVQYEGGNIKLRNGKAGYAMYPVWLMTTKWNNEIYTFAMNGQTGKFVGNLPVDKSIAKSIFTKVFLSVAAASFVVQSLLYFL